VVSDRVKSEIQLWMVGFTAYSGGVARPRRAGKNGNGAAFAPS
jgi:hypothetical protein